VVKKRGREGLFYGTGQFGRIRLPGTPYNRLHCQHHFLRFFLYLTGCQIFTSCIISEDFQVSEKWINKKKKENGPKESTE